MSVEDLTEADRDALREILESQREAGAVRPLLPLDVDVDGDGIVDAWGLGEDGQVALISGVSLTDTCYLSEGDDAIRHLPEEA